MPGPTRNTGYLQNIVQYDASNNITLPANLTVTGTITGYATTSYVGTQLGGYVPTTRTISINGTSLDLSANRSFTINSMVYPGAGIAVSTGSAWGTSLTDNSSNWNTAFGWGNHAGLYSLLNHTHTFASLTSKPTTLVGYGITDAATSAQGTSADTAYGWGNHAIVGYLTGITSGQVTTALGFTPYNATNPTGYITSAALSTYATESYVGTQIANLVASSPAALDTLNELATALGNDAAFSTTVSTALGNRLRVDTASQGLSATLQGYGRTNLGLGTAATANTGDFVAYRTFGTAANSATGDFVAYRTFGTAANNNTGDFAAASHTHSIADVTGLQTALDGKQASGSYAASVHTHIISDVTGLQTALDGKQASLGYTPYNSTNPSGYITSSGSISGNAATATNVAYSGLTGTVPTWNQNTTGSAATAGSSNFLTLQSTSNLRTITSAGIYRQEEPDSGFNYTSTLNMTSSDGRQQLTIARGGDGMKFRGSTSGSGDVSWSSWKTVWHSDNLTNLNQLTNGPGYITGVTNISGYAQSLLSPNGATVVAADSAMPSSGQSFIHTLALGPSGNDGHILGMTWAGTTTVYGAQIWMDTDPTKRMAIRGRSAGGAWTGWAEVLTDANFSSYSPTLTGGSASGTWGISITGTADYAHQLKWYGAGATPQSANTFQKGILSNYYGGGAISNVPDSTYGSLYNFGGYDASSLSLQLYSTVNHASTSSTRTLYFRMGNNLGFQNDWKALLDNTNYSSYALPITGGTISGNLLLNTSGGTSPYFWLTTDQAAHYIKANSYWIDFVGNANEMFRWYNSATLSMKIDGSNNLTVAGDITAYSSDRRLKNNIKNIESGLQKVLSLNGVTFDWDQKAIDLGFTPTHRYNDSGVIAQEVEAVLPQAIRKAPFDDDGVGNSKSGENYLTVQYEKLVPLFIEAIKELKAENDTQKSEIDELKDLVKQLINR